jgi:hypothetical protein
MSLSKEERLQDIDRALKLFFDKLGSRSILEFIIDQRHCDYSELYETTSGDLGRHFYIYSAHNMPFLFHITSAGWVKMLEICGALSTPDFKSTLGTVCAFLKSAVDGRSESAIVGVADVARQTGIPAGLISNIVEAQIIDRILKRHGPEWLPTNPRMLIVVKTDFGLEWLWMLRLRGNEHGSSSTLQSGPRLVPDSIPPQARRSPQPPYSWEPAFCA